MDGLFFLKKAVAALVLPPTGPLVIGLIGLLLLRGHPSWGRRLAATGVLLLFILSMPLTSHVLTLWLYRDGPVDITRLSTAEAIVVIGGGVRQRAVEYGGDTLGRLTLERVRYAALLARHSRLPILTSGGAIGQTQAEADLMATALEEEYGLPVRWRENRSRDTHENAQFSARMLGEAGVRRIVLVTHSFDVPRALGEFNATGLSVIAAPTYVPGPVKDALVGLIPSASALQFSYYATYELLAGLARALERR